MHLEYIRKWEFDHQALEITLERFHKAIVDADSLALRNLTTEELTYGHSSGAIENRDLFIGNLISGKSDFGKIDISDLDITIKGDVAWTRFNMAAELISNGATNPINLKMLYVWTKDAGIWKLLARQAVR